MILVDDVIPDIISNKNLNPIVIELLIRGRKLDIFFTQSYFPVTKYIRLNSTHYFIIKILNRHGLQQIAIDYSSVIIIEDFIMFHRKCTGKPYSFLVIDTDLASDYALCFRKSVLESIKEVIITIVKKIMDEKLQYDINREATIISALNKSIS